MTYRRLLTLQILMSIGAVAFAPEALSEEIRVATYEPVGAEVKSPSGWQQFCKDWPVECPSDPLAARDIVMTPAAWHDISDVNGSVNGSIKPLTDKEHYARSEYWTYPKDGKGDCEDYLLLKRKVLMEKGYPRQALLITVVALANGDGHAVLTVRTDKGDYVLDNLRSDVLPWGETGYRYVKRQSQTDPNVWITLGNESQKAVAAAK